MCSADCLLRVCLARGGLTCRVCAQYMVFRVRAYDLADIACWQFEILSEFAYHLESMCALLSAIS